MNGFELLDKLKSGKQTRNIPISAISTSAMQDQVKKGKKAGFEAYLTKPFEVDSIRKLLERFSTETKTSTE
ncbi:MAG: response regulator [Acidobacteria bacterium]|nr:response regulator [Acidobacteriota bacterium]